MDKEWPMDIEVLKVLCDYSLGLVKIRQEGCSHLCTENNGPETLHKVIGAYEAKCTWFEPTIIVDENEQPR